MPNPDAIIICKVSAQRQYLFGQYPVEMLAITKIDGGKPVEVIIQHPLNIQGQKIRHIPLNLRKKDGKVDIPAAISGKHGPRQNTFHPPDSATGGYIQTVKGERSVGLRLPSNGGWWWLWAYVGCARRRSCTGSCSPCCIRRGASKKTATKINASIYLNRFTKDSFFFSANYFTKQILDLVFKPIFVQ